MNLSLQLDEQLSNGRIFMKKRLEEFQSGTLVQQYEFKSFSPSLVNIEWIWEDAEINVLLEQATRSLSELNAYTQIVPDVDLFISMHIAKEANTSSKIEGTKTEIDEVVLPESAVVSEKRDDWQEVQNYIAAMNRAIEELKTIPLSIRLLKTIHATLLSGVRGKFKNPGEIRTSQNWIGSSLKSAHYVPPHQTEVLDLLSDLEKFWHNTDIQVPLLIRCAISHYQFETIHPFCDGNGRVGRLLIPLYLISKKMLVKPSLYMSAYLEKNREAYYNALDAVRKRNDLLGWCKFFLKTLIITAENGKETFIQIKKLKDEMDGIALKLQKRAANAQRLFNHLYQKPFIDAPTASSLLNVSFPTAIKLIRDLERLGVLSEYKKQSRSRVYVFTHYMDIFMEPVFQED